ncbi:MAG: thioredoxin domain-containing protein [Pseudomonadota bacterium]
MTEDTPENKDEKAAAAPAPKKSDKKFFLLIAALFVVLALMYGMSLGPLPEPEVVETEVAEGEAEEIEQAYSEDDAAQDAAELEAVMAGTDTASAFDLSAATKERILGDASAPIKIAEHSSFSCGHCGKFHQETFKAFKEAYIDTGKAYLVFSDFPLNAPALHATMTSRCVAEERYFEFVDELFTKQDDWAYEPNYMSFLQDTAANYGLDEEAFKDCIRNDELQTALLTRMRAVQTQWQIQSTPSFVVNNQVVINGSLTFEKFDEAIQAAVAQIEAENAEPSTADEAQ